MHPDEHTTTRDGLPLIPTIDVLRAAYRSGSLTPVDVANIVADRMEAFADPAVFISTLPRTALIQAASELMERCPDPHALPLWGVPFAVKDNIDVAGLPTTAACPAFAYSPRDDAVVVSRLKTAGALVTGKTNLDQFATGLNGTRSPYGAPRSVFSSDHISGGSSSGSGVAVAAGLAAFALGTDTAGSGRVPAAFNNIVGIKPTPGLLSTNGMVPACRSLDCVSIFSANVADGILVRRLAEGFDPSDDYSRDFTPVSVPARPRFGVLAGSEREFFGDAEAERLYDAAIARLEALGGTPVPFDYAPFQETALLLYGGPWVAERLAALDGFFATNADDFDPSVRKIVASASEFSALDAFRGRYRLEELRRKTVATWREIDILLLPTTPTTCTIAEMREEPIALNSRLGQYTNFANLLGLAAIAVPAGFRASGPLAGLPAGVTLVGPGGSDDALAPLADALHRAADCGMGLDRRAKVSAVPRTADRTDTIEIAVVGAHLAGLPLNHQLVTLGGRLVREARTTPDYRLFRLPATEPAKPGLLRDPEFAGPGLALEIWSLAPSAFGTFVAAVPGPLCIGRIALVEGGDVAGFLCEPHAVEGAQDITRFGGWRNYLQAAEAA